MRYSLLFIVSFIFFTLSVNGQSYVKEPVNQPNYQGNNLGTAFKNFFKRMEIEGGITLSIVRENDYAYTYNTAEKYDEWIKYQEYKDQNIFAHLSLNTYFPLVQPDLHSVYGIGVSYRVEGGTFTYNKYRPALSQQFKDSSGQGTFQLTNYSLPIYFYCKKGADASFDSRTKNTWGWGLGYVATWAMLPYATYGDEPKTNAQVFGGYPIAYVEVGRFVGSSIKLRLETNFGVKFSYYRDFGFYPYPVNTFNRVEKIYQIFPLRASFVWNPFSIGWERNRYLN